MFFCTHNSKIGRMSPCRRTDSVWEQREAEMNYIFTANYVSHMWGIWLYSVNTKPYCADKMLWSSVVVMFLNSSFCSCCNLIVILKVSSFILGNFTDFWSLFAFVSLPFVIPVFPLFLIPFLSLVSTFLLLHTYCALAS